MSIASQIPIVPVSGFLDVRSTIDEVPFGGYRRALNFDVTQKRRLCRLTGYKKFGDTEVYNNQDLHDQLVGSELHQNISLIHQSTTTSGFTRIFAATQNRIYEFIVSTGNWRKISDLLGTDTERGPCSDLLWTAASTGSITVFTNNVDKPVYYVRDQPAIEEGEQSVALIRDLERLNVSRVGFVISWNNLTLYCDVEQDGQRIRNRIIWSDYKAPLSIWPDKGVSLAGSSDLLSGEIILAGKPMADALLLYTNTGIWEVRVSGDDNVLSFRKRYTHEEGSRCLAYKRTLVTIGDEHYYMGRDGIYRYTFYIQKPELVEYIHRASGVIFDTINESACNSHCAVYFPDRRQIWFSWAKTGETCPQNTLIVGTEFPFCSVMDEGFSAFGNVEPFVNQILRDVFEAFCICTRAQLVGTDFAYIKEGGYCVQPAETDCPQRPQSFWTQTPRYEADIDVTTEDWTKAAADADSFAGLFPDLTANEYCENEFLAGECNPSRLFIMASTFDRCLKEVANVYYREHCTSKAACATYSKDGYKSILTSGALHFNSPDQEKLASAFQMEIHTMPATIPGDLIFRIGVAAQAIDPLTAGGRCLIFWETQERYALECQYELTLAESKVQGASPFDPVVWALHAPGRFLYYEIEVGNSKARPIDTGAALCISRYDLSVRKISSV